MEGKDAGKREDIWVGKGPVHGQGWHRSQSKGYAQQGAKLTELEGTGNERLKQQQASFSPGEQGQSQWRDAV